MQQPAVLALADGSIFPGKSIGIIGESIGEIVFNTSMTGYQEILTDPSYTRQLVTLTYPHIGNTGVNSDDMESNRIFAAGLIIRDLPLLASNWRSENSLSEFLIQHDTVAISEIDTRHLTQILREKGAQSACIISQKHGVIDVEAAIAKARAFAGLQGLDLAKEVSTTETYVWQENVWGKDTLTEAEQIFHVVAYDFGVKRHILRLLVERGCHVTVVPATTSADEVLALKPDGVFLSNGPGDPEPCDYAIDAIQALLTAKIPLFGICLGHQLLALASGANSIKMDVGHHGANHPVQDINSKVVYITSQNHGFAIDENSLPKQLVATHRSLFDGSLQGVARTDCPAFSFQGHPEASPGPHDITPLFDRFIAAMQTQ